MNIGICSLWLLPIVALIACEAPTSTRSPYHDEVEALLSEMTLEEKIGQMTLYTSGWTVTGPTLNEGYMEDVRSGRCGNLFNAHTAEYTRGLQKVAVEETRLGIPLLFGYDVIHGHKTIYPIPLAEACSWDMEMIQESARLAAREAAASGLHWTFNPMVDIARDPRWGRIAEGSGEDPYLGSLIAAAKVRGIQGDSLSDIYTLLACVKHFAAYGAPQAGRDYHTVDMSKRMFKSDYLPPYKAAIDAGCATVMTSFNELDGVPASGSKWLMHDILREQWDFDGFIVTDYTAINEMIPHGYARDEKHAAELSANVTVDMDMQGGVYQNHLADLVSEGKVSESTIDDAVRRILRMKYALGLFDDPYRYSDTVREKEVVLSDEMMEHAREAGRKSIVLLKNDAVDGRKLLPMVGSAGSIALIGPLADNKLELLGSWHASGDRSKVVTLRAGLSAAMPEARIRYAKGCDISNEDKSGFAEALAAARASDVVVMAMGEYHNQSGEAASRSEIDLPGVQQELLEAVYATGKPVVLVAIAGRPLTIGWADEHIPAIVWAWQLGTQAGNAIADILVGEYNPSGKLVITFPRNVGQIPIFYSMKNTGRPFDGEQKYTSKYLDVPNEPLYPFGYGLSYSDFQYSGLELDADTIAMGDSIRIAVTVANNGSIAGRETVQLYVRDLVGSVTRPVKELKGYEQVDISPGQNAIVQFVLHTDDLRFYDQWMNFFAEPGRFRVFVGGNSVDVLESEFELTE